MFINVLVSKTNEEADIEVVYIDYDSLTPEYVRNNISLMVMYHGIDWLDAQADAGRFSKRACPDVGLVCPAIAKGPQPDTDKNPFEIMETITRPLIGLKFLPVESFSMIVNPFK
jgi:hypothetical protein